MPGIATHHAFGRELHRELADIIGPGETERQAFLLGNLGPDPLFYIRAASLGKHPMGKLGSRMHTQRTPELLDAIHRHLVANPAASRAERAYALGFLCHFLLDSTVHPLVYSQQYAICNLGMEGISKAWLRHVTHWTIETEYDEYTLSTRLGATARTMPPHATMLRCPDSTLSAISARMAEVVHDVYGIEAPQSLLLQAVRIFRLAQAALDSKSGGLRRRVDYLKPLWPLNTYIGALSHEDAVRETTVFANEEHTDWPHAFEDGAYVNASFDELFDAAHQRALEAIPRFAGDSFSAADCRELTRGIDFRGCRLPE